MKFYFSSRSKMREEVVNMQRIISERGHFLSYDWAKEVKNLKRPYSEIPKIVQARVCEMMDGIRNSDVFVMISDEEGIDMYGELASAISFNYIYKRPEVYVLGNGSSPSIFPFHPFVKSRTTIQEILDEVEKKQF